MAKVINIEAEPVTRYGESTGRMQLRGGFVPASPYDVVASPNASIVNPTRHARVIGTGLRFDVVQDGDQFYVVKKGSIQPVTKPTAGAFIAYGQLKELEGGRSATPVGSASDAPPVQQHTEGTFSCECPKCGYKTTSNQHCLEVRCPKCGITLRREDRPGVGRMTEPGESEKDTEEEKEKKAKKKLDELTG